MSEETTPYGEEERLAWDIRPDESSEAYRAFCDYREMGKASLNALWERYRSDAVPTPPTTRMRTLGEWSRRYDWVERRRAWVQFTAEIRAEQTLRATRDMADRQARDAAHMQALAMEMLDLLGGWNEETGKFELRPDAEYRFQDVVRLFKVGVEAERVARGEATSIVEERGRVLDVAEMSDDELLEMSDDEA